jgi:hypothetical protein
VRKPGDRSEEPPGGRAAQRLREQLRHRFGDDPDILPEAIRPDDPDEAEEPPDAQPQPPPAPDADP